MDSAKRRPLTAPQKIILSSEKKIETQYQPKNEDIFISEDEVNFVERHEKSFQKGLFIKKIFLILLGIILIAATSWIAFFAWKTYQISKKINSENSEHPTLTQYIQTVVSPIVPIRKKLLRGEGDGRINILLLGAAGKNQPGENLTDTIMIASIDTENKKVALLSLPRDFYVQVPNTRSFTKINSMYAIGIKNDQGTDLIKKTVEKIIGIPIHYYVVIDFEGFQKIIDDIGGINITVERDIYDERYPGPNYSYETFSLKKGFHKLDGATALKYVRERHDDPEGDFGRAKRQQQVIQAVKNKTFSIKTLLNVLELNNILNTLGDNIKTNIAFDDINGFITLSKEVDTQNIANVVVDAWRKESLLKVSHVMFGDTRAFILVPRIGNYSELQDLAQNIFNQDELRRRQDSINSENAQIGIINKSGDRQLSYKIQKLLGEKLEMKNVHIIFDSENEIAERTTVSDNTSGEKIFTLDELIKKLPASLSTDLPIADNLSDDIIITIGRDLIEIYKYEEDSLDDFQKYQNSDEYANVLNME